MSLWQLLYEPDRWADEINKLITNWGLQLGIPVFITQLFLMIVVAVILLSFILLNVAFLTWLERKVAGHIQVRHGPMRTGPHGILQPVADGIKLLFKESITLPFVDNFIYTLSPAMMFTAAMLTYIVLPFAPGWVVAPLDYGLIFVFAAGGVSSFFVFTAGWSSNNKYSLLAGMRTIAQVISYEIPMILAALGVALFAGSLNLVEIVEAQKGLWNIVVQPLGFLLFLTAALGETHRAPFDLLEAEQELVAGYMTEYSGMRFALFYLGEYTHMFAAAALMTTLYLGGWQGPYLPPVVWFLLKAYALVLLIMWFRWTYPRIRIDHLMNFSWKFILPLALINLGVTALVLVW
ncbi:MAG: NADH-quinone oxidoreductase subunit [Clostridia bacterium]|nr:NADH-quinone oxidoreductase subunit [Clostridia bacterium]